MSNQLLYMYNGNLWVQAPGPGLWEAWALDGLNELLELQKCDWSPGLSPGLSQGLRPIPEKFLMHGVDVYPSLSSLPLLTSLLTQDYLWRLGRRGIPPPSNIVPGWLHPGPQVPGVESRHRAGLTVVGPLYPSRLPRSNKHTGRRGVVISSIKYGTHPDIRSLLSLLIGWLTLVPIWIARSLKITMQACHTVTCTVTFVPLNLSSLQGGKMPS